MAEKPTQERIYDAMNRAAAKVDEGSSNWPNMTYEQGVHAALAWVTGQSDEHPMEGD